jgi:citronellol/citronellal dehydrogenase|tara:strand:- start:2283 stop:3191 length:909 start_codon:yes stop_codon:yes gene_type:complete
MNAIKSKYVYVLQSIKKNRKLTRTFNNLKNKTYVISGGTRGVGLEIAKSLSSVGANIAILGRTTKPHPKLEGTLDTALQDIKSASKYDNDVMAIECDVRNFENIDESINKVVDYFGSINGVILNASALCLNSTLNQTKKEIDLMSSVNINGTFTVGQKCLEHIKNEDHGNVVIIAPPVHMLYEDDWWINHLYYSMSKFNMSIMAKFWNKEFPNVSVNTLWPRTTLDTAPVRNILGGDEMVNISRCPSIMGDATKHIILADPLQCTGYNFIDDEVLATLDIDIEKYRINKNMSEKELMPDFFC